MSGRKTAVGKGQLRVPGPLAPQHSLTAFSSGELDLDKWLKHRARANEISGASRTYVVCTTGHKVVGYYCLANGGVVRESAPGKVRRNMPDPIPVMVIGRLAVDKEWQGQRIGSSLLSDALQRILQAAEIAGIRSVLVHAISEKAKGFYEKYGFYPSPVDPMTLMVTLEEVRNILKP